MITGKSSKVIVVACLVVAYSLCSSMLLILNKVSHAAVTRLASDYIHGCYKMIHHSCMQTIEFMGLWWHLARKHPDG